MASAIGTALFCSVLQPMAAKAMDIIKEKGKAIARSMADNAMDNIKRDISRLQTTLRMIKDMVRVAEVKQIDDDDIQNWLRDLVDIGYEARDVLEDFIAYSSCIRVESSSRLVNFTSSQISFLLSYFGGLSSDTSELPLTVLNQLEKDIRSVRERFDEKIKEGETFATLKSVVGGGSESVRVDRRPTDGPFINIQRDCLFLGREEVKQGIMEKILHPSDDHVHVVVIWGMGGIGKTTLARSIYNDKSVKIVPRKWLCVGESRFCAEKVITKIIDFSSTNDVESLQENLVKKFEGKTFLIVLDDVWDVDGSEWKLLFDPLTNVGKGGLIIITRRERQLCDEITIQTAYNLQPLSKEDSWSIFESYAYVNGKADSKSELKPIGEEIVKKLSGLPLALKVVGHSLLNKDSSTWTNFLESKFTKNDEVMSALRWSYNHLPQHLKMCFTCCALFPKNHILDKKLLVRMWMAHDLIQKEERKQPEDVGAQYLEELVNASLLQCVDVKILTELLESRAIQNNDHLIFFDRMYVMHDLIHDLALHVSNGEITTANGSLTNDQMKKVRHITTEDFSEIPHLCNIEKLQTLYTVWRYVVSKQLKSLRVLVLHSYHNFPHFISELKHLRYLDVGPDNKERLPDSICDLYHLQTLVAPSATLPRNIVNMVNLRYIRAVLSTCMGVGKLTYLQELFCIYVCEGDNIRELLDMQLLRGRLVILGLGNVTRFEDAASALMEKQTLIDELKLVFTCECMEYVLSYMCTMEPTISAQLLDALACPPNLKCLEIDGYIGLKFPSLMVDRKHKFDKLQTMKLSYCPKLKFLIHLREFDKLQTLELSSCPKLEFLPFLGELTSLKHLSLSYLYGVKRLGKEFYGEFTDGKVFFPSLESLFFQGMGEWKEWDDIIIENSSVSFFPCLTDLEINNCDKLVSVLPVVKNLTINAANFMTSLSCLIISSCKELRSLPADGFPSSLRHLNINDCPLLYERCKDESGLDWHKINHIPEREIHEEFSLSHERLIYQMGWVRM